MPEMQETGDKVSIPESGRCPGGGHSNVTHSSTLASRKHGLRSLVGSCNRVTKSRTRLVTEHMYMSSVTLSGLTLCDPMGGSPPVFSVQKIFLSRIQGWVSISYSRLLIIGIYASKTASWKIL